jgi:hypothetical protein
LWLIAVALTTQEAEIRRIMVQSQPGQIVRETLSGINPSQKRAGGVAQGVGPEFKPQHHTKKKKKKKIISQDENTKPKYKKIDFTKIKTSVLQRIL